MKNHHKNCRFVILISGRGSNMQKIVESSIYGKWPATICAVISNDPSSLGLQWAKDRNIPTDSLDHKNYANRDLFDQALKKKIDEYFPDYVLLAGFMRILSKDFVDHYKHRLINIHPSLLPSFPGLNTHYKAIEKGVKIHGCTIHFVNSELDDGPIIIQGCLSVKSNDDSASLAERVLKIEHKIFPLVCKWLSLGKIVINQENKVEVKGENNLLFYDDVDHMQLF
ncbi:phosphoribosylglycinamide formyltransferase [Candidatus Kinetoplastibacterium desouzaii TCC079E]|uniref:Phosphoribosylglycinamide formyltransferase n=1 Tax=Candidatus Kinetoplastidibacterium desouzai TCC079E TaxID=1208919 RepID=M1LU27_9PROT|nr:phosphoribosylglycinamide formyltransferase [Candidatus Kinetoplastibacterium desouzaii]AGF46789.1 phosphoribosylglycinamide formyltransferase [Candidatus Kinetoplastibacterium desouzaii TCC079E]